VTGEQDETGGVSPWRGAGPELAIAAAAVTAAALAAAAVAGWPGVVVVVITAAAVGLVVVRALVPRPAAQSVRRARAKQTERPVFGYAQRRFVVASSLSAPGGYQADLRPVLEHLLAARLAENHGINLYTDPDAARRVFCRTRGDQALWPLVDPGQARPTADRDRARHGISRRTLARLVNRLEQL
jgi:hypothetical protein